MTGKRCGLIIEDIPEIRHELEDRLAERGLRVWSWTNSDSLKSKVRKLALQPNDLVVVIADLVDASRTRDAAELPEVLDQVGQRVTDLDQLIKLLPVRHQVFIFSFGLSRFTASDSETERFMVITRVMNPLKDLGVNELNIIPKLGTNREAPSFTTGLKQLGERIDSFLDSTISQP